MEIGTVDHSKIFFFHLQTINGEVIDLNKKAENADYVKGGCGAACEKNFCKLFSKCVDDYNVYKCDCSLTPFYGYFCSLGKFVLHVHLAVNQPALFYGNSPLPI